MKKIVVYLQDLGFSEIEAKLYVTLLEKGPLSVKEITDHLGIQRTRAYPYVEHLVEKGVITASTDSRKKFSASSPEKLSMLVEQKVSAVNQLKNSFPEIIETIQTKFSLPTNNTNDLLDFINALVRESFLVLYDGRCVPLSRLIQLIEKYIHKVSLNSLSVIQKEKFYELKGLHLYLKGRLLGSTGQPETILAEMNMVTNALFSLSTQSNLPALSGYANILLADAYYIAGGYSKDQSKKEFYAKSIIYGQKALPLLHDKDQDKLFVMRITIASAINEGNKELFFSIKQTAEKMIQLQPFDTHITALHLSGVIARGNAVFNQPSPFVLKEKAIKHFGVGLKGSGAFEISDIRSELETLSFMHSGEKDYMKTLATKGSILADQDNLIRYKNYFDKIMPSLQ